MKWTLYFKAGTPKTLVLDQEFADQVIKALDERKATCKLQIPLPNGKGSKKCVLVVDNIASLVSQGAEPAASRAIRIE